MLVKPLDTDAFDGAYACEKLQSILDECDLPLAHGTDSEHSFSIVKNGLGGRFPPGSWAPEATSLCTLDRPTGLLGAYVFALRDEASGLSADWPLTLRPDGDLSKTLIRRYVRATDWTGIKAMIAPSALRKAGRKFAERRGPRIGMPVIFIYEGSGISSRSEKVPSEIRTQDVLNSERMKAVLVPIDQMGVFAAFLSGQELDLPILPLELIEWVYQEKLQLPLSR